MTSSQAAANSTPILPYTGAEYLASLNDDRCVYLHGERVKDIVNHPAFRNSARMIARWYDALHEKREQICVPTDTGSGGFTHPFFLGSKTVGELVKSRDAIAELQRTSYGWMGRTPDYKGAFLGTLGANCEFYGDYKQNASKLVRQGARAPGLLEPCHRPSADRSRQGYRRHSRCNHPRRKGNRRWSDRFGRQGRRDGFGPDALQLHRPLWRAGEGQGLRVDIHHTDGFQGR